MLHSPSDMNDLNNPIGEDAHKCTSTQQGEIDDTVAERLFAHLLL